MQNSKTTISPQENTNIPLIKNEGMSKAGNGWRLPAIKSRKGYYGCLTIFMLIIFTSCSPVKKQVYFENLQKDTTLRNIVTRDYELKIQQTDVLAITVASLSPDVAFYNGAQGAQSSSGSSGAAGSGGGYPVDKEGNITFVKLGKIHVLGLTRKQVKDTLEKALVPYLKDVIVSVAFSNRHITLLGGVTSQVLPMPFDNMTILDALAASGDIGEKGKIDNVLVIRDNDSARVFKRLNLKDNSIFYSPYFYVHPNDIVYVEPQRVKTPVTTAQIITYVTTGISLIFLILNALKL